MSRRSRFQERSVALCAAGWLALNYPLLALADRALLWFGVPVLYLYIFLVWAGLIAATALLAGRGRAGGAGPPPDRRDG